MSWYISVLRQHVFYFKLYFHFFHLCLNIFDMFFYHFMPLFTFSHCLYLSGKLYKMCRLKPMYNRWSSRQQVTEGGGGISKCHTVDSLSRVDINMSRER